LAPSPGRRAAKRHRYASGVPFGTANGISLYYELDGAGERLLFISGTGADLRHQPRLSDGPMVKSFEVLAYDQRGLGQSDVPEGPYTMADYADDAAALLDLVGWDSCRVLGVSFGGMVAQELAIRHPERVRRLALACTSSGGVGGASYPLHELADLSADERERRQFQLLDTRWDADWREANPDMVALLSARVRQPPERGPRLQLEARSRHDTAERLGDIRCPTLVCGGRYDGIAPPANSQYLAALIPGARLEMFDGGHIFFVQDPAAMPAIIDFLSGDGPS
jgi:3-oxoadipate enol-lactonase